MDLTGPYSNSQLLRKLADVIVRLLSVIFDFDHSYLRKANVTPIFKKGKKEDPVNYRLVSFNSILGKAVEQTVLETISRCIKDKVGGVVCMASPNGNPA